MSHQRIKIALVLMLSAVALTAACTKRGDASRVQISNITNNGCHSHTDAQALAYKSLDEEQEWVEFNYGNGVLTVTHHNLLVNCGAFANGIDVDISIDGNTVTINEWEHDGPVADCLCFTDNMFQIVNLPRGTYTFVFTRWSTAPYSYSCTYSF